MSVGLHLSYCYLNPTASHKKRPGEITSSREKYIAKVVLKPVLLLTELQFYFTYSDYRIIHFNVT